MTFRGHTELQEQSRNAAYMSAIMHRVEQMAEARWIAVGDGSRPEKDCDLKWMLGDRSRPEMDRGLIWIATRYGWMTEVDDRTWLTGDGSQEMDHGRRMTINLRSNMNLRSYN